MINLVEKVQPAIKSVFQRLGFVQFETIGLGTLKKEVVLWRRSLKSKSALPRRLVIVPGFGDTPLSWVPVFSLLLANRGFRKLGFTEVILVEFPGYLGGVKRGDCFESIDHLLEATHEILDQLNPEILVGQSMGGYLCAHYSAHWNATQGRALRRTILFCPSGLLTPGRLTEEWRKTFATLFEGEAEEYAIRALGPGAKHPVLKHLMRPIRLELEQLLTRQETLQFLKSFNPSHQLDQEISKIRLPISLYWGAADELIPTELFFHWSALLSKGVPPQKFRKALIPGAGHGVHLDRPVSVANLIAKDSAYNSGVTDSAVGSSSTGSSLL